MIKDRDAKLDQRLEHDIQVWAHKRHRCMSRATMDTATFYFAYWLLCLDGHAFVLVFILEPLAWPLVERSPGVKRLLLASLDVLYRRCWSISRGIWLPMKAPRCFLLLDSFSTKRGNRDLAFGYCLFIGRTPHCQ